LETNTDNQITYNFRNYKLFIIDLKKKQKGLDPRHNVVVGQLRMRPTAPPLANASPTSVACSAAASAGYGPAATYVVAASRAMTSG
jgi:hypothetical protein